MGGDKGSQGVDAVVIRGEEGAGGFKINGRFEATACGNV